MQNEWYEIARWLKPFADALYRWYAYEDVPFYELRIEASGALGGNVGMYSYRPAGSVRVIRVSADLVADVWREEVRRRAAPGYHPKFFDANLHESGRCDCIDEALCAAWVRLIDVLKHELVHLFCHENHHQGKRVSKGCSPNRCAKHGWHCVHFLWYAIRMQLELGGVFGGSRQARLLSEKIIRRFEPTPHVVRGQLTIAPGRIKWYPGSGVCDPDGLGLPAEPPPPPPVVAEVEDKVENEVEDEDEYEMWIGIGA